jgi:hypothetical protein
MGVILGIEENDNPVSASSSTRDASHRQSKRRRHVQIQSNAQVNTRMQGLGFVWVTWPPWGTSAVCQKGGVAPARAVNGGGGSHLRKNTEVIGNLITSDAREERIKYQ